MHKATINMMHAHPMCPHIIANLRWNHVLYRWHKTYALNI
jgi:hypothetical protein